MARTILEDYYQDTASHFELAYKIPRRAREIQRRADAKVAERDDKAIVIALREISERASHYEAGDDVTAPEAEVDAVASAEQAEVAAPEQAEVAAPEQAEVAAPEQETPAAPEQD